MKRLTWCLALTVVAVAIGGAGPGLAAIKAPGRASVARPLEAVPELIVKHIVTTHPRSEV